MVAILSWNSIMNSNITESAIASFIYRRLIQSSGYHRRCWRFVRKAVIKACGDPSCRMMVHGRLLLLPLSHLLPVYLDSNPLYDRLPRMVSKFLKEQGRCVIGIDVGANIGDTVAAMMTSEQDRFLAIEPNPHFANYFRENWNGNPNVVLLSVLCSSSAGEPSVVIQEKQGTARITTSPHGLSIKQTTLDEVIRTMSDFKVANLLKIDTDGYDFEVLRGAALFIEQNKPTVLFECDAFTNDRYTEDFFECIELFRNSDYQGLLLYDHQGNLMGRYHLEAPCFEETLSGLLRWQQSTRSVYFDILLMPGQLLDLFYDQHSHYMNHENESVTSGQTPRAARRRAVFPGACPDYPHGGSPHLPHV
jgi:FkbM family methyltransferase